MRSEALILEIANPETCKPLKDFIEANCLDYEKRAADGNHYIYFHFDDSYPYDVRLMQFADKVLSVKNTFPNRKGIYDDYIELYYEVEAVNEQIDWVEAGGRLFQNIRYAEMALHITKILYTRMEINNLNTEEQ